MTDEDSMGILTATLDNIEPSGVERGAADLNPHRPTGNADQPSTLFEQYNDEANR